MTENAEGLLAKRDELLGEVKALKAKVASLEAELGAATATAEAAQNEIQRVKLDQPLAECLGDMFSVRLKWIMPEVQEHFAFSLADDGVRFSKKNGDPVMIGDREAEFTPADIRKALEQVGGFDGVLLSEQVGGGGKPPSSSARSVEDTPARPAPRQQFGLR
jgi:hypothetical protein